LSTPYFFENLANYVSKKGFDKEICDSARKSVSRYLKKHDLPIPKVIDLLYWYYLWLSRGENPEYSAAEEQMITDIAAEASYKSRHQRRQDQSGKSTGTPPSPQPGA